MRAALAVAEEAAQLAMSYYGQTSRLGVKMKGRQDWLTEADGAVEALLRRRIAELFPNDGFLGEEGGGESAERLWVVDPIDGTANFARGDLAWCISIGYLENGVPELGVINAPVLREVFAAEKGKGATRNSKPIRCAGTRELNTAAVEIGWSSRLPVDDYIALARVVMQQGASAKRSASGALGICWVACGRTDAYLELHINSWDVAAGVVIAGEAGCVVNDFFCGDGLSRGNPILCSVPGLAPQLADLMGLDKARLLPSK
jgi:myo-inositol-1(or 4)-monophosphatase